MQSTIFAVNEEPYCLWEVDVKKRNLEFLNGLDPEYFSYILEIHLNAEDEKRAIISLRQSLHHAIETMFSLLCSFAQAPDCTYAWISKCSNTQLRDVVERISREDPTFITKLNIPSVNWKSIATLMCACFPTSSRQASLIEGFATLWSRLAGELTNEAQIDEYNSLKHGFRLRPGGFALSVGVETSPGVPACESAMHTLANSTFGATFFKIEKLKSQKGSPHIRSRRTSVNWSFERTALLHQLVYMSIHNIISTLKISNGVPPTECKFVWPSQDSDFDQPWLHSVGVTSMNIDFSLEESLVPEVTKLELLERLREKRDTEK
jgi:hypothetical protein